MILHFYLKYRTRYGQQIFLVSGELGDSNDQGSAEIPLEYYNEDYWKATIKVSDDLKMPIRYYYLIRDENGIQIPDGEEDRYFDHTGYPKTSNLIIIDAWNDASNIQNAFYTKAIQINGKRAAVADQRDFPENFSHEFRVKAPFIKPNETVCVVGSTTHLREWDTANPILLSPGAGNWYTVRMHLDKNEWPASYKYGIYNTAEKKFVAFEDGNNRILDNWQIENGTTILNDGFINIRPNSLWRGTGINIPVFSLRSKQSFGIGEFSDLRLLIDWCRETGIKLIQLLPINDTSAQGNWKDSYPYAAISAFALNPVYINLSKVAGSRHADKMKELNEKGKELNALPQADYEQVIKVKRSALNRLYKLEKNNLKKDKSYTAFFEQNKHWLVPYAAFCFLKEKYKTADFSKWPTHSVYEETEVAELVSSDAKDYDKIAIHYFIQYHLDKQLKEIVEYAHKHDIILKGDLPIGIYRYSCDAWTAPSLYNMHEQAGAPPDDFSTKGQNWGFPTYNWERMKEDEFKWWRSRFDQLGNYFDVFRIDHILGFFRIWSIPVNSVDGTMGRFVPALPVHLSEFEQNNIYFDYNRYCKPFINDHVLKEVFGKKAQTVKEKLLVKNNDDTYSLIEDVCTQRKALDYLRSKRLLSLKDGVFHLISNVILFEEENSGRQKFHFRIDINKTLSFRFLDGYTQSQLIGLYNNYFYERQDYFWRKESLQKLPQLKRTTRMLVCGEDLGMVPDCVPQVLHDLGILGLNVQRMPKTSHSEFFHPDTAPYLSIVQPSTHDMSTIRGWWLEDKNRTQLFYNMILGHPGEVPEECTPEIAIEIINQHLNSPAMWSIFLLQDLLATDEKLRATDPDQERINNPSNSEHYWRYRMHFNLEDLKKKKDFNKKLKSLITVSNRNADKQ